MGAGQWIWSVFYAQARHPPPTPPGCFLSWRSGGQQECVSFTGHWTMTFAGISAALPRVLLESSLSFILLTVPFQDDAFQDYGVTLGSPNLLQCWCVLVVLLHTVYFIGFVASSISSVFFPLRSISSGGMTCPHRSHWSALKTQLRCGTFPDPLG